MLLLLLWKKIQISSNNLHLPVHISKGGNQEHCSFNQPWKDLKKAKHNAELHAKMAFLMWLKV